MKGDCQALKKNELQLTMNNLAGPHTKGNLCSTRCYIGIIITEIILLINLEQHLSAGHNCPYLDASQECT